MWRVTAHSKRSTLKPSEDSDMADTAAGVAHDDDLVRAEALTVHYPARHMGRRASLHNTVHAVDDLTLGIKRGETLGLVGESGSGKTTTGRALLRRVNVTAGRILFNSQDITRVQGEELRRLRRNMQMVFQDPYGSLNPRMRVADIIAEPLVVHGLARNSREAHDRVVQLLDLVGVPRDSASRHPHAFSGGQRQRIAIARALSIEPEFIVADEPVSALDVSIQAQIVNLFQDLQAELGLTCLFITHDLSIVRHVSSRVAIMYAGRLVEIGPRDAIFNSHFHPYTEALLSAVPVADPQKGKRERIVLSGQLPNPMAPPSGCRFHTRCPMAHQVCFEKEPPLELRAPGHYAACWLR
jgi:oligopeptide/dipeptide ABC transporter ATP-binding protein